jgi:hypothetical protein
MNAPNDPDRDCRENTTPSYLLLPIRFPRAIEASSD